MRTIHLDCPRTNFAISFSAIGPMKRRLGVKRRLCWLQVFTSANYMGSIAPTLVDANNHLLPGVIEDVFLVCHYSVA
jgi:hypothetical protein